MNQINLENQNIFSDESFKKDVYLLIIILIVNGIVTYIAGKYMRANYDEIRNWAIWNFRGVDDFFKFGSQSFALPLFEIFMIPIGFIGPTIWLFYANKKRGGSYILWVLFSYFNAQYALMFYFADYINKRICQTNGNQQNYKIEKLILFLLPVLFVYKVNSKMSYFLLIGLKSSLYSFFTDYFLLILFGFVYFIWFVKNVEIENKFKYLFASCGFVMSNLAVVIYLLYDSLIMLTDSSEETSINAKSL